MSDTSQDIPEAHVESAANSFLDRVSIVWLVPLGALLLALGLAWQAYTDRGPLIEITFRNGSGIEAGETELRFRDIGVGQVEQVGFTEGLERVVVSVRLDENVADYVDDDAVFWVVRPEITAEGISGLNTVLSGVYIEGSWNNVADGVKARHDGLDDTPVARPDQEGQSIILRTDSGRGLTPGAPILYRGLEVGRVGTPRIATDGISVIAEAFINAPHDDLLTDRTTFWSTSGFTFSIGAQGASLDFESFASLVRGGISFDTIVSGGAAVPRGAAFEIYDTREDAVTSLFTLEDENAPRVNLTAIFEDNVAGLDIGAPVTLRGLDIGEVADLTGQVDPDRFGDARVRLVATLSIRLNELVMGAGAGDQDDVLDFLQFRVGEGLRARLTNASILTGGLKVELVDVEGAAPAALDRTAVPFPIMPTAPAEVENMAGAAQGLLARINALPVEEVMAQVIGFLEDSRTLINDEDVQQVPAEVAELVAETRALIGSEALQQLPEQLGTIATDLQDTLAEFREREGAARLVGALESASEAGEAVTTAMEGVPALVDRIEAVAEMAQSLELAELVDEASGVLADARSLVGSDEARALPQNLNATLQELTEAVEEARGVIGRLEESESVQRLNTALAAAADAAEDVSLAVEDVPALVEEMRGVAARAAELEFEALLEEAEALARAGREVLDSDAARALPERLGTALEEVTAAVEELRAGGTVDNVNATLASARRAADAVAETTNDLPALVTRSNAVLRQAELVLAGLGETGALNREARSSLREVARAAEAVRALARAIERRPNSLLTGR